MSQITLPFTITNGTPNDADQVMANFNTFLGVANGSLEMGTNVRAGTAQPISSGVSEGSSLLGARADHTHTVQGVERLNADPTTGNFVGREYFNTATLKRRLCIAVSPDSWITGPNLAASDLPIHGTNHAFGGSDALPSNSVAQSMFAARTIYQGVPSADVNLTANAWTDIVTGLAVTVTGTQIATLHVQVAVNNPGAVGPVVTARVIDGTGAILWQSPSNQMSAAGASNDAIGINASYPVSLSASPTLKLQVNTSASSANPNQVSVKKSQTQNASTFAVTSLSAVVG